MTILAVVRRTPHQAVGEHTGIKVLFVISQSDKVEPTCGDESYLVETKYQPQNLSAA